MRRLQENLSSRGKPGKYYAEVKNGNRAMFQDYKSGMTITTSLLSGFHTRFFEKGGGGGGRIFEREKSPISPPPPLYESLHFALNSSRNLQYSNIIVHLHTMYVT